MKVCIRADASTKIGSGHIMRCLTLADELEKRGAEVLFVCREFPGHLCDYLQSRGRTVVRLPYTATMDTSTPTAGVLHRHRLSVKWEDDANETQKVLIKIHPKWLIVDHYALDSRWERSLRPYVDKIMVIDDLADRRHDCDLLLDQNLYNGMESRYDGLVPEGCRRLLGPGYALLRPEFREARRQIRKRNGTVDRIFVFFGGSDPTNETEKAIEAIGLINRTDIAVDVVVGASNPRKDDLYWRCSRMPLCTFQCQISTIAALMNLADMAIGAGGTATWERCAMALPAIVISVADNQIDIAKTAHEVGALSYLGESTQVTASLIAQEIIRMLANADLLRTMSERAEQLVDCNGLPRVVDFMKEI